MQERVASPHLPRPTTITSVSAAITSPTENAAGRQPAHGRGNHSRGLSFLKRNPEPLKEKANGNSTQSRARGLSETGSEREKEKENGRSRFTGSRIRTQYTEKEEEAEWVVSGDVASPGEIGIGNRSLKRVGTDGSARTGMSETIGSRVGSVRKRLSMLKLGKKPSKSGVLVDSVAEE
jgi:hypothetical protein